MSGLPITLDLPSEVLDDLAQRVAALLAETSSDDPWLDVAEAAERMRCSKQRVYDLKSQGHLRAGSDGTRLVFRRSTIDAYLEARS